ncbi:MAG: hypothetical protein AB7N76_24875 [Planctomycetota bacterium]
MRRRGARLWLGGAIWLLAAGGLAALAQAQAARFSAPLGKLRRFATTPTRARDLNLPGPLAVGDPVLGPGGEQVGAVVAIHSGAYRFTWAEGLPPATSYAVRVEFDPETRALLPAEFDLVSGTTPMDGTWAFETLLPQAKRDLIAREVQAFIASNEDEIAAFVRPLAEEVVAHGMQVMEANLSAATSKREPEIRALLDAHRDKLRDEVIPVLKKELGPSAKKKADPILREVGRELWDALPMWSLSWRAFVDAIPGTRKDRVDRWWSEFVDTKAIPILSAHEPELMKALEELIEEGAHNPVVRKSLSNAARRLAQDPAFRALVRGILEDSLIRPFQWRKLLTDLTSKPEHRARLDRLVRAFQPALQRLAHQLTVDPETGALDPDLVKVLRRVVFLKDSRWVRVVPRKTASQ